MSLTAEQSTLNELWEKQVVFALMFDGYPDEVALTKTRDIADAVGRRLAEAMLSMPARESEAKQAGIVEPFDVRVVAERDKMWEQVLQYAAAHYPSVEASFEPYMRMVRARLLAPAAQVDPRVEAVRAVMMQAKGEYLDAEIAKALIAAADASRKGQQ